jgi:hypothetical protein
MPLNLHPRCKQRLVEILAHGLPAITTKNGMFLERSSSFELLSEAEGILPTTGELRNTLMEYVDDFPVTDFIRDTLSLELYERDQYLGGSPSVKLVDIAGYEDANAIAQSLVDRFDSLPWHYKLTLELPSSVSQVLSPFVTELPLAHYMRLVRPNDNFGNIFPLQAEDEKINKRIYGGGILLIPPPDPEWDENSIYIQIEVQGFIDMYGLSAPASNAKLLVKALCGLGFALKLFEIERRYGLSGLGLEQYKSKIFVHKKEGDSWKIDRRFDLDDVTSRTFSDVKLCDLSGRLDTEQKKIGWAAHTLKQVHVVFSSGDMPESLALHSGSLIATQRRMNC